MLEIALNAKKTWNEIIYFILWHPLPHLWVLKKPKGFPLSLSTIWGNHLQLST